MIAVIEDDHHCAEVTDAAFWEYNNAVDDEASRLIWLDPAANPEKNYYVNEHGRLSTSTPLPGLDLATRFLSFARDDFIFTRIGSDTTTSEEQAPFVTVS